MRRFYDSRTLTEGEECLASNARMAIFHKDGDSQAFERIIMEGFERHAVPVRAYQLLPNDWHLVL
ncbi:MAG: hypothetical protein V4719_25685 [Planctomycetota bacterium]